MLTFFVNQVIFPKFVKQSNEIESDNREAFASIKIIRETRSYQNDKRDHQRDRRTKRHDQINPTRRRIFGEPIRRMLACLQILLRFVHETVYRSHGALGYFSRRQKLETDQQSAQV